MSSEGPRVAVHDLWKTFWFYRHPFHRFSRWLTGGRHGVPTAFDALRGVTFEVPAGSSTGIIGVNGAGKSTLLKIITGTMEPTRGSIQLQGRIASLLELGTGFHPLFTGRQNIVYNARFLGLTDDEIQERLPEIEAFSELGEFLDRPLRTYSSGMHVRLAFSVAASVSPDILIVDEVLAVGDAYFQQKCIRRIREFRDRGITILFVSHDPAAIKTLCDRSLLLHEGKILDDATPTRVLEHYNALIARKKAESDYLVLEAANGSRGRRSGTFQAVVSDVELADADGRPARALLAGSDATIRVRVFFFESVDEPTVGVLIRDRLGNEAWGTNTYLQKLATGSWQPGETMELRTHLTVALGPGEYSLTIAVHTLAVHLNDPYDWVEGALLFRVLPSDDRPTVGVARLPFAMETARGAPATPGDVLTRTVGTVPAAIEMGDDGTHLLRGGWHGIERTGAHPFRWTEAECTFVLALDGAQLRVEAGATRPAGAGPVELRVLSLGRELGRLRVAPDAGWHEFALTLPDDFPRGPSHVRFVVSETWRPSECGDPDPRVLGIRVRRIWSA